MTFADDRVALPPRHFWRRFLAYLIDGIVLNLLLMIPVMMVTSLFFGASLMSNFDPKTCVQRLARPEIAKLMNLAPTQSAISFECPVHDLFHGGQTSIIAMVPPVPGKPLAFPQVGFFIEDSTGLHRQGLGMAMIFPQILAGLGLPVMFAIFSAYGRQTLGKKLMGLVVRKRDDGYPLFPQTLKREFWKLVPVFLLDILFVVIAAIAEDWPFSMLRAIMAGDFLQLVPVVGIAVLLQLFALVWWLGPFLFWRGQAWHDRLAGTRVVRK